MSNPGRNGPSLRFERQLLREQGHRRVAGMDEVGRGAIAGPVSVGVVVVDLDTPTAPSGVRDSKLLTPAQRDRLAPKLRRWARRCAVGHASPDEIDRWGIIAALRLAGMRALAAVGPVDAVILDGSHDWLSEESPALFGSPDWPGAIIPRVTMKIKADMTCSSVAAASVVAKVDRDQLLVELSDRAPWYGWAVNKGYSTRDHGAAIERHGLSEHHRQSWRIAADLRDTAPRDSPAPHPVAGASQSL